MHSLQLVARRSLVLINFIYNWLLPKRPIVVMSTEYRTISITKDLSPECSSSSINSETLFSAAGHIFTENPNKHLPRNAARLLHIKRNNKLAKLNKLDFHNIYLMDTKTMFSLGSSIAKFVSQSGDLISLISDWFSILWHFSIIYFCKLVFLSFDVQPQFGTLK